MQSWHPTSWQHKTPQQQVQYSVAAEFDTVIKTLAQLPPLITPLEIKALKKQLGEAAQGKRFLLQGGDCAETFAECNEAAITNKIRILLQMSLVLIHGLHKPIIRVGRIAGQYAKPRSADMETQDNLTLPSYRGDLINGTDFTAEARAPNPQRMLQAYEYAALTLNYIRALVNGGFADLSHAEHWELGFAKHSKYAEEYHKIVNSLRDALKFMQAIDSLPEALRHVDFYTSHEALHLPYEAALTRMIDNQWYNMGTHFPWIGMRTAQPDSAHIEYIRGINNPVAVKIGPKMTADWLRDLVEILNPNNEAGRLTLIHRLGADKIADHLPLLIETVRKTGITVLWISDPMHGNTTTTDEGYKTRKFDDILSELKQAFRIHQELKSYLGGVHFELTGENVTECIGGARGLTAKDLKHAYKTLVDPRLNYEQALEMAMLIAQMQ